MLFKFIKMFYFFYHPAAKIGIYMGSARKNEQKKSAAVEVTPKS